jgi:hypothetical protein
MTTPIRRYKIIELCNIEAIERICTELSISEQRFMQLAHTPVQSSEDFTVDQLEIIAAVLDVRLIDLFSDEYIEWKVNHWFERKF